MWMDEGYKDRQKCRKTDRLKERQIVSGQTSFTKGRQTDRQQIGGQIDKIGCLYDRLFLRRIKLETCQVFFFVKGEEKNTKNIFQILSNY